MDENKNEMINGAEQQGGDISMPDMVAWNTVTEQLPPSVDPPKKKKKGKGAAVTAAVLVIVVSAALLICMALGIFSRTDPWERTLEAVFPPVAMLEDMATRGGLVSLDASIASDLSDRVQEEPVRLNAEVALGRGGVRFSGAMGSKGHMLDVGLVIDAKGGQIYSERLLDGGYSASFEGLMEAIDASIFAPDSGTDYALPKELYDGLKEFVDALNDPEQDGKKFEATSAVMQKIIRGVMESAEITRNEMTLTLIDANTPTDVTLITLDAAAIATLRDILLDEWKNNSVFYEELCELCEIYVSALPDEAVEQEIDVDALVEDLYGEIKAVLDEFVELAEQNDFQLKITYATHAGYMVFLSVDARMSVEINQKGTRQTTGATLNWTFTSRPDRDASFDIVLVTYKGSEREKPLVISHRQERERFSFTMETDTDSISIHGTYVSKGKLFVWSVEDILITSADETVFEMTDSVFTLTLAKGNQKVKRTKGDVDLLSMTVEDMDALGKQLDKRVDDFQKDVNAELGFEFIYDVVNKKTQGLVSHEGYKSICDYAYDEKTGHLFIGAYDGSHFYIEMYELQTMELLKRIRVDGMPSLDADNGYVVYSLINSSDFVIHVLDAQTLQAKKEIPLKGMPGITDEMLTGRDPESRDLYVHGDTAILLVGGWNCRLIFIDIQKQEILSISPVYRYADIALDRENYLVGIKESGVEACRFAAYDSWTGELVYEGGKTRDDDGEAIYFDGTAFVCFGYRFMPDGQYYTTQSILINRKPEDREVTFGIHLYYDEDILVTLEKDNSGSLYTMFYELKGKKESAPVFEKLRKQRYYEIRRIGQKEYIALYVAYEGEFTYCVEHFTIEDGVDIDF